MGCGASSKSYTLPEKPQEELKEAEKKPVPPVPEGSSKEEHLQTVNFMTNILSCPFAEHKDGHYMVPGGYAGAVCRGAMKLSLNLKDDNQLAWNPCVDGGMKVAGVKGTTVDSADLAEAIKIWKLIAANVQRTGGKVYVYYRKDLEGKFSCDEVRRRGGSLDGANQVDEIESALSLGCQTEWRPYDSSLLKTLEELEEMEAAASLEAAKYEKMAQRGQEKLEAQVSEESERPIVGHRPTFFNSVHDLDTDPFAGKLGADDATFGA
eukprot:CAMPEP_0197624326 /NCGR_PEP_ID=MMETSP1338-20131121/4010_1 /TAXON_ID=43686 ORGANISM="Pelagodinium beii, Strain RCC1491" /NCGR_SAMPLE_ID=MMETSP1338 /ASSEMBLY_ACC=CAM_ASM_000754 /LENGTH=264 /DNA_ID=CAMNT_0043194447 /DNA_START=35 /DNA_END=829 /DNA_ORIENTATION=-